MSGDELKGSTLAILTSGGDAPGMNAAIRAAALVGHAKGAAIVGIERGYRGLLDGSFRELGPGDVNGILREGGTILGSARCLEFHEAGARDQARARLAERGIDAVIAIGGNGSLTGALALTEASSGGPPAPRVIGIPASIDNDIGMTGLAIGVDTAMNTIVEACDKINDTASAHDRTFIVEVMGRDCGYLAMTSAIAAGADMVLFPEAGKDDEALVQSIADTVLAVRRRSHRSRRVLAIKAEGIGASTAELKQRVDAELLRRGGDGSAEVETRVTVLGHVVRGGRPSAFDRLLGSRLANVAVRALAAGASSKMAAWMPPGELPAGIAARSPDDPYCWLVDLAAVLAETERLLGGSSPLARWRASVFDDLEDVLIL
jgi:6-phosphofructokinase 1